MQEVLVTDRMTGQRMDRTLARYLDLAPKSFIYRMLRKKNITLNDKKASGSEKLQDGDVIRIWLSEETIGKFSSVHTKKEKEKTDKPYPVIPLDILYEDKDVMLVNKPAGMLSQKARSGDESLNEYVIGYLLSEGAITEDDLQIMRPSVCNRLDRNTSGIVCVGKTQKGLRVLGQMFRDRSVKKYYQCIVLGMPEGPMTLVNRMEKDRKTNKVSPADEDTAGFSTNRSEKQPQSAAEGKYKRTDAQRTVEENMISHVRPLHSGTDADGHVLSLLEVELVTGKTHQIRAQLACAGYPLAGDRKYGTPGFNDDLMRKGLADHQMLCCIRIVFPEMSAEDQLPAISCRSFTCRPPEDFLKLLDTF